MKVIHGSVWPDRIDMLWKIQDLLNLQIRKKMWEDRPIRSHYIRNGNVHMLMHWTTLQSLWDEFK